MTWVNLTQDCFHIIVQTGSILVQLYLNASTGDLKTPAAHSTEVLQPQSTVFTNTTVSTLPSQSSISPTIRFLPFHITTALVQSLTAWTGTAMTTYDSLQTITTLNTTNNDGDSSTKENISAETGFITNETTTGNLLKVSSTENLINVTAAKNLSNVTTTVVNVTRGKTTRIVIRNITKSKIVKLSTKGGLNLTVTFKYQSGGAPRGFTTSTGNGAFIPPRLELTNSIYVAYLTAISFIVGLVIFGFFIRKSLRHEPGRSGIQDSHKDNNVTREASIIHTSSKTIHPSRSSRDKLKVKLKKVRRTPSASNAAQENIAKLEQNPEMLSVPPRSRMESWMRFRQIFSNRRAEAAIHPEILPKTIDKHIQTHTMGVRYNSGNILAATTVSNLISASNETSDDLTEPSTISPTVIRDVFSSSDHQF